MHKYFNFIDYFYAPCNKDVGILWEVCVSMQQTFMFIIFDLLDLEFYIHA